MSATFIVPKSRSIQSQSAVRRSSRLRFVVAVLALFAAMTTATRGQAYEISDNGDSIILMDATYDEYILLTTGLMPEFRVRNFTVLRAHWHASPSTFREPLYSCIFERNVDDIDVHHQVGLTASQLQAVVNNLDGNMEMMQVLAYRAQDDDGVGYVERYGYLAYDREGPDWTVYVDMPREWIDAAEAMLPSDQNIVNRCFTSVWPSYMTALYKADNTETIDLRATLSEDEFIIMRDHLAGEGFRVTSMRLSHDAISPGFLPIFKRDGHLRYTTEAFARSDSDGIADLHQGQVSHMQPIWIVPRPACDFIVGFQGEAVWSELLQPSASNGFFDPHLTASPKPHDSASKSKSTSAASTKTKAK